MTPCSTALVAALLGAALPAGAATLVRFDIAGAHSASFDILEAPVPASFTAGASFVLDTVHGTFEGVAGTRDVRFFNDSLGGGLQIVGDFTGHYNQLYRGPESGPTIYTGDYQLIDAATGGASGLIIYEDGSTVAEPATWALLVAGFALTGGVARRRSAAAPT